MHSLWEAPLTKTRFGQLDQDRSTDVLVIGGGLAGVLCAYMLRQAGADVMLAEAKQIGCGVTCCTTAKLTAQHGLLYDSLLKRFGADQAKLYLRANLEALRQYRALCARIDCHFEEQDNYVYALEDRDKLDRELAALQTLGFPASLEERLPLPLAIAGAVRFPRQAQFHPGEFIAGIAEGLPIFEHTAVRELIGTTAVTDRGRIKAKRIVIATHFPILNKHGLYFLKLYQQRSYVIALENAPQLAGMYVDEASTGLSFRSYQNLLLLGGGGHRTGKTGGCWFALREFARKHYPDATEKYHWATQDCMTLDGVPYIGRYSKSTENLYVATGFNKWGMTSSMVAASLLTDMLQGKSNPYEAVFDPSRSILRPQLLANGVEAAVSLLTPTSPRCPHLGCALKWNRAEHTWDCACHGSRFREDGELLDNPATGDLKRK